MRLIIRVSSDGQHAADGGGGKYCSMFVNIGSYSHLNKTAGQVDRLNHFFGPKLKGFTVGFEASGRTKRDAMAPIGRRKECT